MISSLLLCFDPMSMLLICVEVFGVLIEEFRRIFVLEFEVGGFGVRNWGVWMMFFRRMR